MREVPFHEAADIFPLLAGVEYDALVADIKEYGLHEPIWLYKGKIIDGRNRYRACKDANRNPHYREWEGAESDLVPFVVSMNLKRRHLNSSQLAFVALAIEEYEAVKARERMVAGGIARSTLTSEQGSQLIDYPGEVGRAAEKAAEAVGTNRQYVSDAKRLQDNAPDLSERIKQGRLSITGARVLETLPQEQQQKALALIDNGEAKSPADARRLIKRNALSQSPAPTGKFRVVYADPPWHYGNSGAINDDNYGRAERHYPTMTIEELCAFEIGGKPIRDIADNDAVLFMWVTSPLLEECSPVIKAWGFKYKSSFVWDKVKHNFGHYNSVRHELLLICTRGSCLPESKELHDSVIEIERSDQHSEKPAYFRTLIERMYPSASKIELFARGEYAGWVAHGNQVATRS